MVQIPHKLMQKVIKHFQGDVTKAKLWFEIDNPMLNGMKPKHYHQGGRWDRLSRLIDDALQGDENEQA